MYLIYFSNYCFIQILNIMNINLNYYIYDTMKNMKYQRSRTVTQHITIDTIMYNVIKDL